MQNPRLRGRLNTPSSSGRRYMPMGGNVRGGAAAGQQKGAVRLRPCDTLPNSDRAEEKKEVRWSPWAGIPLVTARLWGLAGTPPPGATPEPTRHGAQREPINVLEDVELGQRVGDPSTEIGLAWYPDMKRLSS